MNDDPNHFEILAAVEADTVPFAEFGARTFYESFIADNTPEDMEKHLATAWHPDLQRREILDPTIDTLLARDSRGVLAGFAQVRDKIAPEGIATQQPIELWRFYVDKPWHGRGLARALMEAVFERARARGGRDLWLGVFERNERARAFYRKCGFEKVGDKIFVVGNDPQRDHVMMRTL
jgi:ribosomal protein S18 acetylase RimI-like enzyme